MWIYVHADLQYGQKIPLSTFMWPQSHQVSNWICIQFIRCEMHGTRITRKKGEGSVARQNVTHTRIHTARSQEHMEHNRQVKSQFKLVINNIFIRIAWYIATLNCRLEIIIFATFVNYYCLSVYYFLFCAQRLMSEWYSRPEACTEDHFMNHNWIIATANKFALVQILYLICLRTSSPNTDFA